MAKNIIKTNDAPAAIGPYSQAVVANGFIYVSGQIPINPATGTMIDGDISIQTKQVMDNIKAILAAAGANLIDVIKTNVYLADMNDFGAANEVYATYFTEDPPARACLGVAALPKGAKIEIDVIAVSAGSR